MRFLVTAFTITALLLTSAATSSTPPRVNIGQPAFYSAKCADAWVAVRWYRAKVSTHRRVMHLSEPPRLETGMACPRLRERARYWIHAAKTNRHAVHRYLYEWQRWLPEKYAQVGACETGYGKQPGNWQHDSGTYVSAFGIIRPAYDSFARSLGLETWDGRRPPREQYHVARAIQARYGWGAWGCGGA